MSYFLDVVSICPEAVALALAMALPPSRSLRTSATIEPESIEKWMTEARSRTISPESLHDGTWLLTAAEENLQSCQAMSGRSSLPSRSLTWGSCCSGSEGVRFCFDALNILAKKEGRQINFEHVFSCEANPDKIQWIAAVNELAPTVMEGIEKSRYGSSCCELGGPIADSRSPCLFTDICTLGQEHAACAAHRKDASCPPVAATGQRQEDRVSDHGRVSDRGRLPEGHCFVPQVDILILGTSCKDMSRANPNKSRSSPVLLADSSKGGSAQTFRGMLAYTDAHSPSLIVFENVDTIDDRAGATSNLDILLAEMGNRGYESQVIMSDAAMMGLPAKRRRVYVVFLKIAGNPLLDFADRSMTAMLATLRAVMCSCLRSPCCATQVFLPQNDPAVISDLVARTKKRDKMKEAAKKTGQQAQSWLDQHLAFAKTLKYRWGQRTSQDLTENAWFQTLTEREQDVLRLARVQSPGLFFRDLSQSIARANVVTEHEGVAGHCLPTILPKMLLWCEQEGRVWLGREALMCQGFPVIPFLAAVEAAKRPQAWTPSEALMGDWAGNAMSLPVVLAILQSLFTALSWQEEEKSPEASMDAGRLRSRRRAINDKDRFAHCVPLPHFLFYLPG